MDRYNSLYQCDLNPNSYKNKNSLKTKNNKCTKLTQIICSTLNHIALYWSSWNCAMWCCRTRSSKWMCCRCIKRVHSSNLKKNNNVNKQARTLINDKLHTLKCAKSSSFVRSDSSRNKEYTSIQPYTLITVNTAPRIIMVKL